MDIRMPDPDGIGATWELSRADPATKVLILTTFEQDDYIFGALRAGPRGSCSRTRPEELIAAVHTIAAGDSLLSYQTGARSRCLARADLLPGSEPPLPTDQRPLVAAPHLLFA